MAPWEGQTGPGRQARTAAPRPSAPLRSGALTARPRPGCGLGSAMRHQQRGCSLTNEIASGAGVGLVILLTGGFARRGEWEGRVRSPDDLGDGLAEGFAVGGGEGAEGRMIRVCSRVAKTGLMAEGLMSPAAFQAGARPRPGWAGTELAGDGHQHRGRVLASAVGAAGNDDGGPLLGGGLAGEGKRHQARCRRTQRAS